MKRGLIWIGVGAFIVAFVLVVPLRWGVWLPDLVNPKADLLDEIVTPDGEHFRLIQLWVVDGYLTEFWHTKTGGKIWTFAIDGDAAKAWRGNLKRTNDAVIIKVLGTEFPYDTRSHVIRDRDGVSRVAEEIPPGTPIVPPR